MAQQIQSRNGTAAAWTAANPTLMQGEIGAETDTNRFKIGNGSTAWNSLGYATGLQWKGTWSSATAYVVNDVVTLSNVVYIAILAGTNQPPASSPTYWTVMLTGSGNVSGPGTSVVGNVATFNNTSGTLIQDSGKVLPSGTIVGTSDAQTLTNKTATGLASSSTSNDSAGTGYQIGYRQMPQNSQTGATYTLALSDDGKHIYANGTTTSTITVPANGTVAFPVGTVVNIVNFNSGNVSIVAATGVTLYQANSTNTGTRTLATKGVCALIKLGTGTGPSATDQWVISGAGIS